MSTITLDPSLRIGAEAQEMPAFHFDGTLPLRLFHPERFFGMVEADGQTPRVAAIAAFNQQVIALRLVGYDTSVSAALARLWGNKGLTYLPPNDCTSWRGSTLPLERYKGNYKQFTTRLDGTREVSTTALYTSTMIGEGIRNPAEITEDAKQEDTELTRSAIREKQRGEAVERCRFILGNWDEATPNLRAFMGHLYAIRVIFLQHDDEHPQWPLVWANELWQRGLTRNQIVPIVNVLGVKAWAISGSTHQWSSLIGDGIRQGWLPCGK